MTIYVAEILGRTIAAFSAEDDAAANGRLSSVAFRADLSVLQNQGRALWDGSSDITARRATGEEGARWEASRATAIREGELGPEDTDWVCYLVPVSDFDDDDDDDDDGE